MPIRLILAIKIGRSWMIRCSKTIAIFSGKCETLIKMAVVIGSERNIKVTAEDNSTSSKSPTFVCSPDDQVSAISGPF